MEVPENQRWMYNRIDPSTKWVTIDFERGVEEFLAYALQLPYSQTSGTLRCPCVKCKCRAYLTFDEVKTHIYKKGFMANYYVWTSHGERRIEYPSPVCPIPGALHASREPLGNQLSQCETKKRRINGFQSEAGEDIGSASHKSSPSINNTGLHPAFGEELCRRMAELTQQNQEILQQNRDLKQATIKIMSMLEEIGIKLSGA